MTINIFIHKKAMNAEVKMYDGKLVGTQENALNYQYKALE